MDMNFRDDECRIRTDHAPANFTTIKHMALNLKEGNLERHVRTFFDSISVQHARFGIS
jgi:predicted transposase YbfD/YdcC